MNAEIEIYLSKLIEVGDGIEVPTGNVYPALGEVSERVYRDGYVQRIVPVQTERFQMPIHVYCIKAIWRNGAEVWRDGETVMQRRLFE